MRNLPPAARKHLIETLCPREGWDQAMMAGKHIPHSLLSEKIRSQRRRYDTAATARRKKNKPMTLIFFMNQSPFSAPPLTLFGCSSLSMASSKTLTTNLGSVANGFNFAFESFQCEAVDLLQTYS